MTYSLPERPALAEVAATLQASGHWALVVDDQWRLVFATDARRLTFGAFEGLAPFTVGGDVFGPEAVRSALGWRMGLNTAEFYREFFLGLGGYVLADTPGGLGALRIAVDRTSLVDVVDQLTPTEASASFFVSNAIGSGPAGGHPRRRDPHP